MQVPDSDSRSAALAGAIVAMSESLQIVTVAEGIENAEQAERMRGLGCTYGQGYFFSRPLSGEDVAKLARRGAGARQRGRLRRRPRVPARFPRPARRRVDASPA